MDYAIPSAAELCIVRDLEHRDPEPPNPLGAKGIGESGTIGSTPAIQNAVIDAVSHLGVRHIDMPHTAQRVWEHITAAQAGTPIDPWREPPAIFAKLAAGEAEDEEQAAAAEQI